MPRQSKFAAICSAIILILSFFSCGSSKHSGKSKDFMPGTWQSTPVIIDGDSKDWPSPYPNFDAKAEIAYATSNDKENLYITMETGDELTQMKILKQGMIVSIDTSGGKNADFHINFPLPNDSDPIELPHAAPHKQDPGSIQGKQLDVKLSKSAKDANQFSLEGFINCNGGFMVSQNIPCGIKVIARIDEYKELVWEAVVPMKTIYNKVTIDEKDADRPISVCFAIKGFKNPSTKGADNGNGISNNTGGTGANLGGRSGGRGGHGGGGARPAENPLQHLYESTKTWKHFALVYKP